MSAPPAPRSFPRGSRRDRSVVDYEPLLSALEQVPDVAPVEARPAREPATPVRADQPS